jgi:hypothetical protein
MISGRVPRTIAILIFLQRVIFSQGFACKKLLLKLSF